MGVLGESRTKNECKERVWGKVRVNDADRSLDNVEDGTEANSPPVNHSFGLQHSNRSDEDTHVHSGEGRSHHEEGDESCGEFFFCGSGRLSFPKRNPDGDGAGSSLRRDAVSPTLFVTAWNLTTHSILNDVESCRDMMINLATHAQEHLACAGQEADLVEKLAAVEKENDDLLDKNREREERINYHRWMIEGVKFERTKEDAEVILADAADYDPYCKDTFMSAFNSLFTKSYPYVEKLAESFRLPLGDLQNMWSEGTEPTLSGNAGLYVTWPLALGLIRSILRFEEYTSLGHWPLDSSGASCVPGNICHLAIGAWTYPERLHSGEFTSLGHWRLDSSGASCIPRNIRNLAIGAWTYLERLAFR
nr:hypothetical protein [Tanacetum cinerariifolium]